MARTYLSPPGRRRTRRRLSAVAGTTVVVVFVLVWWLSGGDETEPGLGVLPSGPLTPAGPAEATGGGSDTLERGAAPSHTDASPPADLANRIQAAVQAGQRALEKDDILTAQTQMSAALRAGASGEQATELRARLVQLANKVVFSPPRVTGDPRSATYLVKRGDNLRKIAKQHKITADLIARVNNLRNKSMIREGARLKVLRGPFQAVVLKRDHTMDIYLDDVLVRTYKVGLGEHDSTPTGTWRVKNKLTNPTYFPPRGGKIIQADDPKNPLGEHWIGLEGVAGEAKNQLRYGIHGTNDPNSIGKDMSLGCIRLLNEDVTELYSLLVVGSSQVIVKD